MGDILANFQVLRELSQGIAQVCSDGGKGKFFQEPGSDKYCRLVLRDE